MSKEKASRPLPQKIQTEIWAEVPQPHDVDPGTPITLCHGYDFYNDLLGRFSWIDLLFLLIKGELPSKSESAILNILMCASINPGPRDWATQAAMTAAASKTTVGNCLLSGLAVLQGRYNGALCVEKSINLFQEAARTRANHGNVSELVASLLKEFPDLPGYGLFYGNRDERAFKLIERFREENHAGEHFLLALEIEKITSEEKGIFLNLVGAVSSILADLGFTPEEGHGLYLISAAPGLLAHLLEQRKKGWNALPFFDPPEYNGPKDKQPTKSQIVYGEKHG